MHSNTLTSPLWVQDGPSRVSLSHPQEGLIGLGPCEQASITSTKDADRELMQWKNQKSEAVRSIPGAETVNFAFTIREDSNALGVQWGKFRGKPVDEQAAYYVLDAEEWTAQLSQDAPRICSIPGRVQTFDATNLFPAPSVVGTTTPVGGAIVAADSGHVQVVHIYMRTDKDLGGVPTADQILASFAAYHPDTTGLKRGRDFVAGTVGADAAVTAPADNDKIIASWTDAVIPAGAPKPTHTLLLVGAAADSATKKIAAIVAFGTLTATVTSIGTVAFGADPSIDDLAYTARGSVVSGVGSWSALTRGTDFTYDEESGETTLAAASANAGLTIKTVRWFIRPAMIGFNNNQRGDGEFYAGIVFEQHDTDDTNPATQRSTGFRWILPYVNMMTLNVATLQGANDTGFGSGFAVSGKALTDPATGYAYRYQQWNEELGSWIDVVNRDVLAAEAAA